MTTTNQSSNSVRQLLARLANQFSWMAHCLIECTATLARPVHHAAKPEWNETIQFAVSTTAAMVVWCPLGNFEHYNQAIVVASNGSRRDNCARVGHAHQSVSSPAQAIGQWPGWL